MRKGQRAIWVVLFVIVIYITETKNLPDTTVLLIGLSLIVAWMAWETRIWKIFKKSKS